MKKIFLLIWFVFLSSSILFAQGWSELKSSTSALNANGTISKMVIDPKDNVYVTGNFKNSNGKYYIAKWDGNSWTQLDTLVSKFSIDAICADPLGNIYASGYFFGSNLKYGIMKWNGSFWNEMIFPYINTNVNNICADALGNVYITGSDLYFGASQAQWNGNTWSIMSGAAQNQNNEYSALLAMDSLGNVYAGNGGQEIQKWNGISWSSLADTLPQPMDGTQYAIAVDKMGNVYSAGDFFDPKTGLLYVAKWDGVNTSTMGEGFFIGQTTNMYALTVDSKGNLYVGGDLFMGSLYNPISFVAKWNGISWSALDFGNSQLNDGATNSLVTDNKGNIYAAGSFKNAYGFYCVAKYAPSITTAIHNQIAQSTINIYPNPSTGFANLTGITEDVQLTVYNALGQTVAIKQVSSDNTLVDLNSLNVGVYTLLFKGTNSSYVPIKWIKE